MVFKYPFRINVLKTRTFQNSFSNNQNFLILFSFQISFQNNCSNNQNLFDTLMLFYKTNILKSKTNDVCPFQILEKSFKTIFVYLIRMSCLKRNIFALKSRYSYKFRTIFLTVNSPHQRKSRNACMRNSFKENMLRFNSF